MWGLSSIIALPATSASMSVSLILLGVLLFAGGSCREAYLRGGLSAESTIGEKISVGSTRRTQASKSHDQVLQTASNPVAETQISEVAVHELNQESIVHDQER